MSRTVSRCRSCGSRMIWARTDAGSLMPVDFDPHPGGNIAIRPLSPACDPDRPCSSCASGGKPCEGWEAIIAGPLEPVDGCSGVRRKSHFATCPEASKHRRKR